jgi:hypothetical protein
VVGPYARSPYAQEVPISTVSNKRGQILVPTPGQDWWAGGWFTPPPTEAQRSRELLTGYRASYDDWQMLVEEQRPWPWRLRRATATGLPTYLRGWLDEPLDDENYVERARIWLDTRGVAEILLGRPDWCAFFQDEPEVVIFPPATESEGSESVHVHFPQRCCGSLRVLGGHLTVHMARHDDRASASSVYLPLAPERSFEQRLSDADAINRARRALAHYAQRVPEADVAIYGDVLARLKTWQVAFTDYGGAVLAVLPFAGDYRLSYSVCLSDPDGLQTWCILVDAERGVVLGRPEPLHYHALAYASSQEALAAASAAARTPPQIVPPSLMEDIGGVNPAGDFMDVFIGTGAARQVPAWATSASTGLPAQFEATNVAIHAAHIYRYLRDECGVGQALIQPPLAGGQATAWPPPPSRRFAAEVGVSGAGELLTYFRPADRLITFQTDDVDQGAAKIYAPVRDPELIYHEVTHGLMWTLNSAPFDHTIISAPFARALVEGLANYFARSLGQKQSGSSTPSELFAAAAYRAGEWQERWALSRTSHLPGQDYLPLPNLYPNDLDLHIDPDPSGATVGIYDVGMICARTLWTLRVLAGRASVDQAVIESFWNYTRGWTTSFEALAEGLHERAQRDGWVELIVPVFASRGVIADQGIQALASASNGSVVVGADAGVMRRDPTTGTWDMWGDLPTGEQLRNVVDLAVRQVARAAPEFYAATETAIFHRTENALSWSQLGPDVGQRPLCLAVDANGNVFVGTGRDVRVGRAANPTWGEIWLLNDLAGNPPPQDERLALDIAVSGASSPTQTICVAGYNAAWTRRDTSLAISFVLGALQMEQTDMVTCVLAHAGDDTVFVGSGNVGVWQGRIDRFQRLSNLQRIGSRATLGDGAVLCLAEDGTGLFAGTSAGIFQGTAAGGIWSWQILSGLPLGAAVTSLALTSDAVYAGTAIHGLWRFDRTTQKWKKQLVKIASSTSIPDAPSPANLAVPANLLPPPAVRAVPFCMPAAGAISFNLGQARHVELWHLEKGLTRVADAQNGSFVANNQPPGFYLLVIGRT